MRPGTALPPRGTVRRPDGTPASGATVSWALVAFPIGVGPDDPPYLSSPEEREAFQRLYDSLRPVSVRTDADGRYEFGPATGLATSFREQDIDVWAAEGDLVSPVSRSPLTSPAPVVDLCLAPAFSPSIEARTSEGLPVADAHVTWLVPVPAGNGLVSAGWRQYSARTDGAGVARMPRLAELADGPASITLRARELPLHEVSEPIARLRDSSPLALRISRGFTIRGRVVDPGGGPCAGAHIASKRGRSEWSRADGLGGVADAEGAFEISGVPCDVPVVVFVPQGELGRVRHRFADGGPSAMVTLRPRGNEGEVVDLGTVRLQRTLEIRGVVRTPKGVCREGAYISLDGDNSGKPTDGAGRFVIRGVEPGRHVLEVRTVEEKPRVQPGGSWLRLCTGRVVLEGVEAGATDVVLNVPPGSAPPHPNIR